MRFFRASREEELALSAAPLNHGVVDVDDETTHYWKIRHRLSAAAVLRKAVATVWTPWATASIELKVHLRAQLLAANLVHDIPVEIV